MTAPENFRTLVELAQGGDRDALERLLVLMRPRIEQVVRAYADPARPDQSTSDLVQESWLRTWRGIGGFRGRATDEEFLLAFRVWVEQIAERTGLNARRNRETRRRSPRQGAVLPLERSGVNASRDEPRYVPAAPGPSPSTVACNEEEAGKIQRALAAIGDLEVREVVRLRFFEELPLTRVAERLSLSYDQARGRFEEGMKILERELADLE